MEEIRFGITEPFLDRESKDIYKEVFVKSLWRWDIASEEIDALGLSEEQLGVVSRELALTHVESTSLIAQGLGLDEETKLSIEIDAWRERDVARNKFDLPTIKQVFDSTES